MHFYVTKTERSPGNPAPDLMPLQGYFSDDEMHQCANCDAPFAPGQTVKLVSGYFAALWYEPRLAHLVCPAEPEPCPRCGGDGEDQGAVGVLPRGRCKDCGGSGVDPGEDARLF